MAQTETMTPTATTEELHREGLRQVQALCGSVTQIEQTLAMHTGHLGRLLDGLEKLSAAMQRLLELFDEDTADIAQEMAALAGRVGEVQDTLTKRLPDSDSGVGVWLTNGIDEERASEVLRLYALRVARVLDLEGTLTPQQTGVLLAYEARDALRSLRSLVGGG